MMRTGMKPKAAAPTQERATSDKTNTMPAARDYLRPAPPGAWEQLQASAREALTRRPPR